MEWTHTTVQHGPRKRMGISSDDYTLLDLIYHTQTSPKYGKDGWCEHPYSELADVIGIGKGGLFQMADRLTQKGLMEVDPANPKRKRATELFSLQAYHGAIEDEMGVLVVQKVNAEKPSVQKVNDERSESERNRSESERQIKVNKENIEVNNSLSPADSKEEIFEIPQPTHVWGDNTDTRYQTALQALKSYFEKNSFRRREISDEAKNTCNEAQFDEELTLWLRRYSDDFQITQNPVKALTSGRGCFISWLSQSFCRAKYQTNGNDTQTGRNGRVQQQRPVNPIPSNDELKRKYGVLQPRFVQGLGDK